MCVLEVLALLRLMISARAASALVDLMPGLGLDAIQRLDHPLDVADRACAFSVATFSSNCEFWSA